MNQTTIDTTFQRLGLWVGYRRKRLLQQTKLARYRQENFILTNRLHPYFDYPSGHAVCSRTTLSNLENGGLLREPSLLPYFMRKLGVSVRFSESNWLLTQTLYERFEGELNTNLDVSTSNWLKVFDDHRQASHDNVLFSVEYPWLKMFLVWLNDPSVECEVDPNEFLTIYPILNPLVQGVLSDWVSFLILSQPNTWPKATTYLNKLIEEGQCGEWVMTIWHLFKGTIHFSPKSFGAKSGDQHSKSRVAQIYHAYLNLMLNAKPSDQSGLNPVLTSVLLFKKTKVTIDQLKKADSKQLIRILRHEPYPHNFRKRWILEMAWHIKVTKHYKRFLDLFVDLNSIDQELE